MTRNPLTTRADINAHLARGQRDTHGNLHAVGAPTEVTLCRRPLTGTPMDHFYATAIYARGMVGGREVLAQWQGKGEIGDVVTARPRTIGRQVAAFVPLA